MLKKSILYNLFGSIFDKGLPLIISAMLTKFMSTDDYGRWSLFYVFMIISNAISTGPMMTIFARKFFKLEKDNQKMHIYFFQLFIGIQILSFVIYYTFFSGLSYDILLEIPCLLLSNLYSYLALFLRFKGLDKKYMYYSFIRLAVFAIFLIVAILVFGEISYTILMATFLFSHIPSFLKTLTYLAIQRKTEKGDLQEFLFLGVYGLSTSLVNGMDKFIIVSLGFNLSFLGYYSFIYALTNAPTIIIEALKKTMNPVMYKEWTNNGKLSRRTMKTIYYIAFALLIIQFVLPQGTYMALKYFNFINPEFVKSDSFFYINILSIGFFFQGIYHFVNPYYFFYKKSGVLLAMQVACIIIYGLFILNLSKEMNYDKFMWLKTVLLMGITLLCIGGRLKFSKSND